MISRRFSLGRRKMLGFLDRLEVASGEGVTLYLPPGSLSTSIDYIKQALDMPSIPDDIAGVIIAAPNGVVVYWGVSGKYIVLPPFPISEEKHFKCCQVGALRAMLEHDFTIGLVLVRLGAYATGIARGDRLISGKVGTGLVHGRHRQGGSSQHRFERHREKQIEYFLGRVCGHVLEQFSPHHKAIDYLVYGGARTTIDLLKKECSFLGPFEAHTLPPLLTIPDPRRATLETAVAQVWTSQIIEYRLDS